MTHQLVVGEEEEAGEGEALHLEVVVQPLLHDLEHLVLLLVRLDEAGDVCDGEHLDVAEDGLVVVAPHGVLLLEELALLWHLPHDVVRSEDGLQVLPHALHFEPDVDQVLDQPKLGGPPLGPSLEGHNRRRAEHRLRLDDVIVEEGLHLLGALHDGRAGVAVRREHKLERLPLAKHLVERLL